MGRKGGGIERWLSKRQRPLGTRFHELHWRRQHEINTFWLSCIQCMHLSSFVDR